MRSYVKLETVSIAQPLQNRQHALNPYNDVTSIGMEGYRYGGTDKEDEVRKEVGREEGRERERGRV